MDTELKMLIGASEAVSVLLVIALWRGQDGLPAKLLWTQALAVPFFGPVVYAVWHDPPPPSDPIDRPSERIDDVHPPNV